MTDAPHCIFLNGLPGSGKSTFARSFIESRRGWLNLDVDVIRGLLGTFHVDFLSAGAEVQPLALAVLREQIAAGGNVIFPQLFFVPEEARPFEEAVVAGGGHVHRVLLKEETAECWRRVEGRANRAPSGSVEQKILTMLSASGGVDELQRIETQLFAWMDLPEPLRVITSATPFSEVAALAYE
ncbi:AAA family ATPase [Clavibacter michiganensis]|uniref:Uncharacterized protein n=1 Tax=Clavibacter michiganensis subsp. insidiosus TaxID=33014 RepID=A0A399N4I7_9MICO|nr:AAA family ATPase [Clavibacter michiganensis]AWF99292.1 hypothetical protein BEH61_12350 [Clavibacter michiganensis subsp. insidiosus]AWG00592.1 hypothetical protein BEH62_03145 [Clavibacter michiganensis subsp. insidiosus]OQJ60796.1 hypothetical protein B5P21_13390 [Clavibacter michiganensis subsp. insidiosus]RII88691.1 hypothetical protein DZF92_02090 [Clavibacter michiganensis subsp. insidiosus]RIJ44820.1 hypothetical protein DZF93_01380 [Clavibacter michiganensis subsp. insidiosus]